MAGGGSSGFGNGRWYVDIEKLYQGEYWTNRYVVQAADLASALNIGNTIAGIERTILRQGLLMTKFRVSDGVPDTDVYQVQNVNQFGTAILGSSGLLPLFNVVRFDLNTAGGGRPSRKYFRGFLREEDVDFNAISQIALTYLNDNYAIPLAALAGFVDVDGQEIVSGSAYPFVGMRQLRRGSKRKAPVTGTPL